MTDKTKKDNWIEADSSRVMLLRGASGDLEFEKAAAKAYAVMFNTLDALVFVPLLAEDVRYSSQMVLEDLHGRERVVKYFLNKVAMIEKGLPDDKAFAELGEWQGRPCVVVAQGQKEPPGGVVLFSVKDKTVTSVDMCTVVPNPEEARRFGIYPEAI
jgi:hypothetical protein